MANLQHADDDTYMAKITRWDPRTLEMRVTAETTVMQVKEFIHANWGVPIHRQNLSYSSESAIGRLQSDGFTFGDYGLTKATLKFIVLTIKQPEPLGNQAAQQGQLLRGLII